MNSSTLRIDYSKLYSGYTYSLCLMIEDATSLEELDTSTVSVIVKDVATQRTVEDLEISESMIKITPSSGTSGETTFTASYTFGNLITFL